MSDNKPSVWIDVDLSKVVALRAGNPLDFGLDGRLVVYVVRERDEDATVEAIVVTHGDLTLSTTEP